MSRRGERDWVCEEEMSEEGRGRRAELVSVAVSVSSVLCRPVVCVIPLCSSRPSSLRV